MVDFFFYKAKHQEIAINKKRPIFVRLTFLSLLSESNQWPTDYKSVALPAELRRHHVWKFKKEPLIGIEPMTYWLQVSCSTSWAKEAFLNNPFELWWCKYRNLWQQNQALLHFFLIILIIFWKSSALFSLHIGSEHRKTAKTEILSFNNKNRRHFFRKKNKNRYGILIVTLV